MNDKEKRFKLDTEVTGTLHNLSQEEGYCNPPITYLDEVEDDCWELFKKYSSFVGAEFDKDSEIDFATTKAISEFIIKIVEDSFGIKFPIHGDENIYLYQRD